MGLFRCLVSDVTTNYLTGTDLGTSSTTVWTLINTPLVAGSVTGTILQEGVPIQTFAVDVDGNFTFANIGSPGIHATSGTINLGLGTITLGWTAPPGANSGILSYTGLPVYKFVTMMSFGVSCPPPYNPLCNPNSTAMVAACTICAQHLWV